MAGVRPIPEGYHTVTPYLIADDVAKLIEFTKRAFGAKEIHSHKGPDGRIAHADVVVGDSHIMMGGARGAIKPMPCALYLYVPDVDALYKSALAAGATSLMAPADQFYGDRNGGVQDFAGNQWWISTHVEDVAPEELERRAAVAMKV